MILKLVMDFQVIYHRETNGYSKEMTFLVRIQLETFSCTDHLDLVNQRLPSNFVMKLKIKNSKCRNSIRESYIIE
jgi:hypothetical protein